MKSPLEMIMTIETASANLSEHSGSIGKAELTDEQLRHATGGTFEYGKVEVVYTAQMPDGTARAGTGDPDEEGSCLFKIV
jgi:hypothetical protein